MRNKFFSPVLFVLLCSSSLFAQNKYDLPQLWKETGWFFTQPFRWDGEDWYKMGFVTTATGFAMIIEPRPSDVPFFDDKFYNHPINQFGEAYGEPLTAMGIMTAYAGYSIITGDRTTTKIAYELFQTCAYSGMVVYAIKNIVGRARPRTVIGEKEKGKYSFKPLSLIDNDNHSFPSGHTTLGFAVSTILSLNADPLWLKILAYIPAVFTPFSRAYQGEHWISDCAFGLATGYFIGKWVYDTHERGDQKSEEKSAIQIKSLYPFSVSVALD